MKIIAHTIIIAAFFFICACNKEESGATYNKTYITGYKVMEGVVSYEVESGVKFSIKGDVVTSGDIFDQLSKIYNDTSFNRNTICGPRTAIADEIIGIKAVTAEYFDTLHPAGSDVSDLIECIYVSYYDYVRNGYKEESKSIETFTDMTEYYTLAGAKLFRIGLSEFNDVKLFAPDFILKFNTEPEKEGEYRFDLNIQSSGKEIKTSFRHTF